MPSAPARPPRRRRVATPAPEGSSPDNPIRTRALTKQYGDRVAVDALDLEIRPGEIFGLLGQNGAGKTTTILMLLGLTEPTGGTARVLGMDPTRRPLEIKRRVGYLPDSVGFYGNMTGRENLRYTARLNGLDRVETEDRIDEVLEQVGLSERGDSRTETYSRGMLQRLGIADALLKDPDVLILDEPTASIDPIGVDEVLTLLRRLVTERRISILLSSHLLNQVQSVCDRVGVFADGRLIGVGTVPELAERFGFSLSHVEVVLDAPAEQDPTIAKVLTSIDGVTDARVGVIRTDDEAVEVAATSSAPAERKWILTTEPGREVHAMIATIVQALADYKVVRIGRHEPTLDEIYRRAATQAAASRRAAREVAA